MERFESKIQDIDNSCLLRRSFYALLHPSY
jgi:hypothetical protein